MWREGLGSEGTPVLPLRSAVMVGSAGEGWAAGVCGSGAEETQL